MTKAQKIIVLVAAVLMIVAVLYPPYYLFIHSTDDNITRIVDTGWEWIIDVSKIDSKSYAKPYYTVSFYSKIRFDILGLEIFGILVLAGAALLITNKAKQ
jgi:hypothetical protein